MNSREVYQNPIRQDPIDTGFDNAFVFKYSPRPGTRSAALPDDVPTAEKERRDQVLLADQERRGQARNDRLVGTVREVMVEGPSKRNAARWSGRDGGNRIVVWDKSGEDTASPGVGDLIRVKITEAHPQILIGQPFGLNEGLIRDYVIDLSEREKWSTEK